MFVEVGDKAGIASMNIRRGAQVVDLNLDGMLDLVVVNRWVPAEIWRQTSASSENWVEVRLQQDEANRDAIGSVIEIRRGDKVERHEVAAGEAGNTCDIESISSPDNLTFLTGYNTLVIAEDTEGHQNDAIWSRDMATGSLTRILSTPYGAEATSVDWYPNVNGHAYLMAVVQHPFGETDEDKLKTPDEAKAYVGYVGPFPVAK
ncbi:MAG: hypothetical protein CFE33_20810 [Pseudorhodobacter sp. PARRP1]|nr:MAG: hypothetical protein CFE33_20810 [Pseudorhodobacter sp. PARRP1]